MKKDDTLEFIEQFYLKHGTPPTTEEIVEGTSVRSNSHVSWIIKRLVSEGSIFRPFISSRTFVPAKYHPARLMKIITEGGMAGLVDADDKTEKGKEDEPPGARGDIVVSKINPGDEADHLVARAEEPNDRNK